MVNYPKGPVVGLILLIVTCFGAAGLGQIATGPQIDTWYAALAKPAWTPPNWIFGPVWSLLYLCMAFAAWRVWQRHGWKRATVPLSLFLIQLLLNVAWSWLFFYLQGPGIAFAEIVVLWVAIAATTAAFWHSSRAAGLLMFPYLVWVSFAVVLNFAIWRLNA